MQYTADQAAEFKREFAARRRRQMMVAIPLIAWFMAFAIIARIAKADGEKLIGVSLALLAGAFFALIAGVLVFSFRNWRCPACGRYLGRDVNMKFCPKCGVGLQ